MSEIAPNAINPLLPDFYFMAALAAHAPLVSLVGSRFGPARDGFEPAEFATATGSEGEAWPYVLFGPSEDGDFDLYAGTPTLLETPFFIGAFMREDIALSRGQDFEDATGAISQELQVALAAFGPREIGQGGQVLGQVHGCELGRKIKRTTYGPRGRRISDIRVFARILCN